MLISIFLLINFFKKINGNAVTLPLYGNVYNFGYYYIKVNVGLPLKQEQTLIVDTGSSLTGFACLECINCGLHENNPFNINLSTTSKVIECKESDEIMNKKDIINYSGKLGTSYPSYVESFLKNKCIYKIKYSEGSEIFGYFFEDYAEFENKSSSDLELSRKFDNKFIFGCNLIENSFFKLQKASGILGLANYSKNKEMNKIFNFIFQSKDIRRINFEKIISIFLETDGGKLTFGSTLFDKEKISDTQFEIKNITRCDGDERYCAYINRIEIDSITYKTDTKMDGNSFKAIFDTGTTISIFPARLFNKITRSIFNKVSKYYPKISGYDEKDGLTCWKILNGISVDKFPNIKLIFKSNYSKFTKYSEIDWPPESYLYMNKILEGNIKVYCLGIASNNLLNLETNMNNYVENYSNVDEIILGATFFIYKEVTFFLNENKIAIREKSSNNYKNYSTSSININSRNINEKLNSKKDFQNKNERMSINAYNHNHNNRLHKTITENIILRTKLYVVLEFIISSTLLIMILFSIFTIYKKLIRKFEVFRSLDSNL